MLHEEEANFAARAGRLSPFFNQSCYDGPYATGTQDVRMTNISVHSKIRVFHSVHSSLDISPKYLRPYNTRQEMRRKRTNIHVKENLMSHIWTLRFDDARKGKQERTEGQN